MNKRTRSFASLLGIGLLATSMTFLQSCGSDGKKESHTEDAMEHTGDAIAADSKDAAAKAKENADEAGDKTKQSLDEAGDKTKQGLDEAGDKIKSASNEAVSDFKRERDEAVAGMKKQQAKLDADIEDMKADIKRQGAKAKEKSKEDLAEAEQKRKELGRDIDKAQNATADAWQDIKAGFKQAGRSIGNAFDKAGNKLDGDGNPNH